MAEKKNRILVSCVVGLVLILVASLFVSWANPLDKAIAKIIAENDLKRINHALPTDETGFSANLYAFKPDDSMTITEFKSMLTSACSNCTVDLNGDYLIVQDAEEFEDVTLQVEYSADPGWRNSDDMGALITVTRYGPPRKTLWDWIGGLFG